MTIDGHALQLSVHGAWNGETMCVLTGALAQKNSAQLHALAAFQALMRGERFPAGSVPPDNRARRHLIVCNALDGRLLGLSDRQIAERIFGERRVQADWADPGDYLKDRTRRAIRRGLYLMRSGYRDLLK